MMSADEAETIVPFLVSRVRRASDARLVLISSCGIITVAIMVVWQPRGAALLSSAASACVAFGLGGIADRELSERQGVASPAALFLLRVLRASAVVLGTAAILNILALGLAASLGTWIS
jgi:hypothetical protein